MPSLLKRTIVLSISRFAGQAILLFSPMLLVRILSVGDYGQYREFLLYANLIAVFVSFGIQFSLLYLIPKYPEQEQVWITQTTLLVLAASTVAVIVIFLAGDFIRANTSFDFVTALQLYVLFVANLDYLESYWLSKKRTDNVLYYSLGYLVARITVVLIAASLTKDAYSIVSSLVVLEGIRCLLILIYASRRHWFSGKITRASLAIQFSYFLPLGTGGVIDMLNHRGGMLFISTVVGTEALAFYVIGSFATQLTNILRGAIADVIFPEIVELRHSVPKEALPLWKQATVWYCILLFPMVVFFSYYSREIVTVLFTENYAAAIPVFSAFAFLMYLSCFDFHLPLRVQNANRFFLIASVMALVTNFLLLYPAYLLVGLIGPVVALLLAQLVFTIYLGFQVTRIYKIGWKELLYWRDAALILIATLICAPVLVLGRYLVEHDLLRCVLFGGSYFASYLVVLRLMRVFDALSVFSKLVGSRMRLTRGDGPGT